MKKLIMSSFVFIFAASAQALELKFKFQVNSSGPYMYACNAGLKHTDPGNKVCYSEGTNEVCDPSSCTPQNQCNPKCLCSSGNGGAYRMDFMKAKYGAFNGASPLPNNLVKEAGATAYNTLFTDANTWGTRIEELSFNLGSERYGAKYFVDICYHGSQIEYFENNVPAPHALYGEVLETDLSPNPALSYRTLSSLAASAEWSCDKQGEGSYVYARNSNGLYDTFDNEVTLGGKDIHGSVAPSPLTGNTKTLLDTWVNQDSHSPRFCKVRYYFDETAVNNLRTWQRHDALMCTFTKIEEANGAGEQLP